MVREHAPREPVDDLGEHAAVTARLDELLGDRSEREIALVTRLVGNFPVKASGLVERWSTAILAGDREEAARAVHTLKGAALNLGALTLSRVCEQTESWCRSGGPDGDSVYHDRLVSAVTAFARTLAEAASARTIAG